MVVKVALRKAKGLTPLILQV